MPTENGRPGKCLLRRVRKCYSHIEAGGLGDVAAEALADGGCSVEDLNLGMR